MDKFKILNGYFFALIFLLVSVALLFKNCEQSRYKNKLSESLEEILKEKTTLEFTIDSLGRQITKSNVIELPQNMEDGIKENESLTKLETKISYQTITKTDTLKIYLSDTIIVAQGDTIKYKQFNYKDEWICVSGNILRDTLLFDSIEVKNEYVIEIGKERKWLLGREKQTIYIRNNNPHTLATDVLTYQIANDKKWFQKDYIKYGLGALGMFFIVR